MSPSEISSSSHRNPSSRLSRSHLLPSPHRSPQHTISARGDMAGGEASQAIMARKFTAQVTRSPRFLLPRASGGTRLPALPSSSQPGSPDLVLGGDIRARFDGWPAESSALDLWGQWVAKLRPVHEPLWRELGILEGILATTYRVRREGEGALLQLVPFWSGETNTFVFPWGEATVTLEDVAVLAGLPLVGLAVRQPLSDSDRRERVEVRALEAVRALLNKSKSAGWVEHFVLRQQRRPDQEAAGAGGGRDQELLEHGAFLSMWLSRFVLPAPPVGLLPREEVFPIAVRLARGQRAALAPAALASIYSDLSALKRHFVRARRTEAPSVSAPMHILQLWVWERFPELRPAAAAAGIPDSGGGGDDVPRAARWHDVGRALDLGYVRAVLAAPKKFEWRPYGSRALLPSFEFARCLHPCELVGMACVEQHSPHRVARQLGFDQDVPGITARLSSDSWEKAWETYDVEAGCYASAVPSDKPGVTDEYVQWWKPYSLSCANTAAGDERDGAGILDGKNEGEGGNGGILASNKKIGSRLEDSLEASKRGSSGNREKKSSSRPAEDTLASNKKSGSRLEDSVEASSKRGSGKNREKSSSRPAKGLLASNKKCGSRLEDSVEASKRGSGSREKSSSKPAEGNTGLGSSSEVCTRTLYYLSESDLPKEAWAKDANSTGAGQDFFQPKQAVGTKEMIQKASEMRQAEIAALRKNIAELAKKIREEEGAEPPKK